MNQRTVSASATAVKHVLNGFAQWKRNEMKRNRDTRKLKLKTGSREAPFACATCSARRSGRPPARRPPRRSRRPPADA